MQGKQSPPWPASTSANGHLDHLPPSTKASQQPVDTAPEEACPKAAAGSRRQDDSSADALLSHPRSQNSGSRSGSTRQHSSKRAKTTTKGKKNPGKILARLKDWTTTSEPSARALKQYRKEVFQKAGIALDDPEAAIKLDAPIGQIPDDAIKPGGRGPDPEDLARRRTKNRKEMMGGGGIFTGTAGGSSTDPQPYDSPSGSRFSFDLSLFPQPGRGGAQLSSPTPEESSPK